MNKRYYLQLKLSLLIGFTGLTLNSHSQNPQCTNPPNCVQNSGLDVTANFGDMNSNQNTIVTDWYVSHGTPSIATGNTPNSQNNRSIVMWSHNSTGEGIYTCYNFQAGVTYNVCYWVRNTTSIGAGNTRIVATNGLQQNNNTVVPAPANQQIIQNLGGNNGQWTQQNIQFTANANYRQLWIYPFMNAFATNPGLQYVIEVDDIRVTPNLNSLPNVSITSTADIIYQCQSATITLNGIPNNIQVQWNPSTGIVANNGQSIQVQPCTTTVYSALLTDPGCATCPNTQSLISHTITVIPNTIQITGDLNPICGQSLSLSASSVNPCNQATTWSWTGPNGLSVSGPSFTIPSTGSANSGVYTVTAVSGGCSYSKTIVVAVQNCVCAAVPDFTWTENQGTWFFSGVNNSASPVVSWFWDFGDGFTSTLQNPIHGYSDPGTYPVCLTVIAQDAFGNTCSEMICKNINYYSVDPGCAGSADFTPYILGCTVYFADLSTITQGNACEYRIDFGDGTSETGTNPWFTHNYWDGGYYNVEYSLIICSESGVGTCADVEYKTIYVPCFGGGLRTGEFASDTTVISSEITLTPNPANAEVSISVPSAYSGSVSVVDMTGREVLAAVSSGILLWTADISSLAPGTYMVIARNDKGESIRSTLIKQ